MSVGALNKTVDNTVDNTVDMTSDEKILDAIRVNPIIQFWNSIPKLYFCVCIYLIINI